ncbi:glycerate kinase [Terribacillus saccharophilus]|uniref:glycerate kinase n=1 Tax=Terribacillus saccharophilus TaxID=361277 RepID=UPI00398272E8
MKIVVAPDSFKESMTALEAAAACERGILRAMPDAEIVKVPMADGGEGTVQSLVDATHGKLHTQEVTGPLGNKVTAVFGMLGDGKTAVIEMAEASGLHLVPRDKRDPFRATTRGTGELMLAALQAGAEHIIIGLGGSATNDGGAGMAAAFGVEFLDAEGKQLQDGPLALKELSGVKVDGVDPRWQHIQVEVACDVENPLTGENGASFVFGPQKGANGKMVRQLDDILAHYAAKVEQTVGKKIDQLPGAGAAGGLGAGLVAFLPAELKSGITIVKEATGLADHMKDADLVITGEGKIDGQTIFGKTPIGVAKTAKQYGVPVIAIAGNVGEGSEAVFDHGIDAVFSIMPGVMELSEALANGETNIEQTVYNICKTLRISQSF